MISKIFFLKDSHYFNLQGFIIYKICKTREIPIYGKMTKS